MATQKEVVEILSQHAKEQYEKVRPTIEALDRTVAALQAVTGDSREKVVDALGLTFGETFMLNVKWESTTPRESPTPRKQKSTTAVPPEKKSKRTRAYHTDRRSSAALRVDIINALRQIPEGEDRTVLELANILSLRERQVYHRVRDLREAGILITKKRPQVGPAIPPAGYRLSSDWEHRFNMLYAEQV